MVRSKGKKLSIDIILFAISSFGTKFLSFFLVPFYTNFLSTEEYGAIDLLINTVTLIIPIFTLCIYESVMRFTIDDKNNPKYFKIGCGILTCGAGMLGLVFLIIQLINPNIISISSLIWIWILFVSNAIYNMLSNYVRAIDRVKVIVEASIINSAVNLTMNILLIAYIRIGVNGFFISLLCGLLISSIYMLIRLYLLDKKIILGFAFEKKIIKEMIYYSIPLIFTAVAWWINSSLDRYFVTGLMGASKNGIYSVAYKIPNILVAFQSVFNQAWSISAITEFNKSDEDAFIGRTYETFGIVMTLSCACIMLANEPLSKILYAKEFYEAAYYVPYLLIATLFSSLAGYFGGIFAAVKNSKICAISTVVSAIINTILNVILIPLYGIHGAAIATMIAYFSSWFVRMIVAKKYVVMKVNTKKLYIGFMLLVIQMLCSITENHYYTIQIIIILLLMILFKNKIKEILGIMINKFKRTL